MLKLSSGKSNLPGPKQVHRYRDGDGRYAKDVITSADEAAPEGSKPLLGELMADGRRVSPRPPISEPRARFAGEFTVAALPGTGGYEPPTGTT